MTWRAASARLALVALVACAGQGRQPASQLGPRTWERPGLGGAVRPAMGSPQPGEAAPELALPALDGRSVALSSLRGGWVVLHFTATWCPFCAAEMTHLGELADHYASRGVRVVVVDIEEPRATWNAYARGHVEPAVVALLDETGRTAARFAPPAAQPSFADRAQAVLDATLILDPEGTIRLFLLPDSAHFDPTFRAVRSELELLVPAPVVVIEAPPVEAAAGSETTAVVTLRIADGLHLMSDRPSDPLFVATALTLDSADDVTTGPAAYPPARPLALGERTLETFAGAIAIRLAVRVAEGSAPGPRRLRGRLRFQACTATRCLFPATVPFALEARVVAR